MLRISIHVLILTAGSLLLALGATHFVNQHFGDDTNQVLFQTSISHPSMLGGERQRTFIKVDLTGFKIDTKTERSPVNVALVLDKSGSMNGEKMEQAKYAAIQAVEQLGAGDRVSIIVYDNTARVLLPATDASDRGPIRQEILQLQAGGGPRSTQVSSQVQTN